MIPATLLVAALVAAWPGQGQNPIALEVRVFDGPDEVTAQTRITVYRAGDRNARVVQLSGTARLETQVTPAIYDVQAIREVDGNVVSIRWSERLVVMPYPDENGRHLEVVNFRNGFGALQVRGRDRALLPEVTIHHPGVREKEAAAPLQGPGYALFVLPAGKYDLRTGPADRPVWHADVEVPLDRTRLWIVR